MGNKPSLQEQVFNLKLTAKSMQKQSAKAEAKAKQDRVKVKESIEKKNQDVARVHAENAIRQQQLSLTLLRLSSRLSAVAARVEASANMSTIGNNMKDIVSSLGIALDSMDVEKLSMTMDEFEKQVEALDIQSAVMEKSIQTTTASTTPEDQVEQLMRQVADEHKLEFQSTFDNIKVPSQVKTNVVQAADSHSVDDHDKQLASRLAALKSGAR